jgi:hypothetical protein
MAKMFPPHFTHSGDKMRNAERRFYDACKEQLGDEWTVLYEVKWFGRRNQGNERGDADFLLMSPEFGIFCVEVKGGQEIFLKDNQWFTVPHGMSEPKQIRDPFAQAADSKSVLWNYIRDSAPHIKISGAFGHFVVFPGASVEGDVSLTGRRSLICDKSDLASLLNTISRISNTFGRRTKLSEENIDEIRKILLPDLVLISQTQVSINELSDSLELLTEQQLAAFEMLRNQKELVVTGGAGTGKTVLAFNRASTLASQGARTIYLCHSTAAAKYLRSLVNPALSEVLDIRSLDEFVSEVMEAPSSIQSIYEGTDIENISIDFLDKALRKQLFFDALIVDEAQNIPKSLVELLTTFLPNAGSRYIYIFGDVRQNILRLTDSAIDLLPQMAPIVLEINCRSSLEIADTAGQLYNEKVKTIGPHGPKPVFLPDITGGQPRPKVLFGGIVSATEVGLAAKYLIRTVGIKAESIRNIVTDIARLDKGVGVWTKHQSLLINPDSWEAEYLISERHRDNPELRERVNRQLKMIDSGFHVIKSVTLPDLQGLEADGVILEMNSLSSGFRSEIVLRKTREGKSGLFAPTGSVTATVDVLNSDILLALQSSADGSLNESFLKEWATTPLRVEIIEQFKSVAYTAITRTRHSMVLLGAVVPMALLKAMLGDSAGLLRFDKEELRIFTDVEFNRINEIRSQMQSLMKGNGSKEEIALLNKELKAAIEPYRDINTPI